MKIGNHWSFLFVTVNVSKGEMIYIDPKSCNENLPNKVFAHFANQREEFQSIQWFTTEMVHPIQPDSHEFVIFFLS